MGHSGAMLYLMDAQAVAPSAKLSLLSLSHFCWIVTPVPFPRPRSLP